jgi:hypothetical protein
MRGLWAGVTTIIAALAALAVPGDIAAQEALRVVYAIDSSNPEQVQMTGTVFNDSMQDVFDVSVTAEALDARGKVVARGIAHVGARIPGRGSAPFVCKVPSVPTAVHFRASATAARAGVPPQAP